jgi:hypothetical protein
MGNLSSRGRTLRLLELSPRPENRKLLGESGEVSARTLG